MAGKLRSPMTGTAYTGKTPSREGTGTTVAGHKPTSAPIRSPLDKPVKK